MSKLWCIYPEKPQLPRLRIIFLSNIVATLTYRSNRLKQSMQHLCLYVYACRPLIVSAPCTSPTVHVCIASCGRVAFISGTSPATVSMAVLPFRLLFISHEKHYALCMKRSVCVFLYSLSRGFWWNCFL